ncbi:MAG: ABC transporter substrate-binding protein [Kosmotogaceae bacterium]
MRKILLIIMLSIITVTSLLSQKIVVAVMQDPDFLDPHRAAASGTYEMMFNVFEGLLKPDPDGTVIPAVAESYSISEDGMIYTFALRSGVKFHDGSMVTVDDVFCTL